LSPDKPDPSPLPDLQAKLDQLERYKEVVFKRAQLEEAKDKALMPPPRPGSSTGSTCMDDMDDMIYGDGDKPTPGTSSTVSPLIGPDEVNVWQQQVAGIMGTDTSWVSSERVSHPTTCKTDADTPEAPAKTPVISQACTGPAISASTVIDTAATVSVCGVNPPASADTAATVSVCGGGNPPASADTAATDAGPSTRSMTKRKREEAGCEEASSGEEPEAKKAKVSEEGRLSCRFY